MKKLFVLFLILLFAVLLSGCPEESEDSNKSDKNAADLNQLNDFNAVDKNVFDSNASDENSCTEDWECSEWSECINGKKSQECWDNNECGLANNLTEIRDCNENVPDLNAVDDLNISDLNIFDKNGNCIENWNCTEWSECINGWEKRSCAEQNNCSTTELSPRLYQHCGECIHEETADCITDGDCNGTQTCVGGEWQECVDTPGDDCFGECQGDYTRSCTTAQGCLGLQNCNSWNHTWGLCYDFQYDNCPGECILGQTRNCTTTDKCPGTQTCSYTSWNPCQDIPDDNCPKCIEAWYCYDWGSCVNGTQSRKCLAQTNCGTENEKPALTQSCNCAPFEITVFEIKEGNMYYSDDMGISHNIPLYSGNLSMRNQSSNSQIIDGKTIWYKINFSDANSDGNITFRKNSSTGPIIKEISYINEDYSNEIIFEGANGKTHKYVLMVNDMNSSTVNIWLFLKGGNSPNQQITTQYNKHILLYGTDTTEHVIPEHSFFLPHSPYLPAQLGGGTEYKFNEYFVAAFKIDEDGDSLYEITAYIDTGFRGGNVIVLPNNELDWYSCEVSCEKCTFDDKQGCLIEDPSLGHPTSPSLYTIYGSHIELNNHHLKITFPKNTECN
ncbi:MAG: hypothetical protein ABIJ74_03430 [archaeon]